ncbi:MAG: hypothetical protein K2H45_00440, partial [Acetatifactor sp.]|nr:hypothetical protein [Acetatifactor sp.]
FAHPLYLEKGFCNSLYEFLMFSVRTQSQFSNIRWLWHSNITWYVFKNYAAYNKTAQGKR